MRRHVGDLSNSSPFWHLVHAHFAAVSGLLHEVWKTSKIVEQLESARLDTRAALPKVELGILLDDTNGNIVLREYQGEDKTRWTCTSLFQYYQ